MKKLVCSEDVRNENQTFLKIIHSMWKKTDLLRQITLECTSIFPAKSNPHFSKRAQIKVCNLGYELAENYKQLIGSDALWIKLNGYTTDLTKMWKDANVRGFAPLIETELILFIIKDLKADLRKVKQLKRAKYLENAV